MKSIKSLSALAFFAASFLSFNAQAQNSGTWNPGWGNDVGIETQTPDGQLEIVSPISQNANGGDIFGLSAAWRTNAFVITRQWTCAPFEWDPNSNPPVLKPLMWVRTNMEWNAGSTPIYQHHLFMDKDGNMALGTNQPGARLHVNGNSITNYQNGADWSYANQTIVNNAKVKALTVGNGTHDLFIVWGNGVVNTKKLYAEELQVTSSAIGISWPDYVFKKDYSLMSLKELETYVQQNHHLPEVPSESEVQANGVNVGEFNKVLLKKVEELTLYMIELQKENEALSNRLKALEAK